MRIRAVTVADRELVQSWIEADTDHVGKTTPEFFTEARAGVTLFALVDVRGDPVIFVALEKMVRGHIQFDPAASRGANVKALLWLGGFLKTALGKLGVREFITDSHSRDLIGFLERGLGMRKLGADYSARIPAVGEKTIQDSKFEIQDPVGGEGVETKPVVDKEHFDEWMGKEA